VGLLFFFQFTKRKRLLGSSQRERERKPTQRVVLFSCDIEMECCKPRSLGKCFVSIGESVSAKLSPVKNLKEAQELVSTSTCMVFEAINNHESALQQSRDLDPKALLDIKGLCVEEMQDIFDRLSSIRSSELAGSSSLPTELKDDPTSASNEHNTNCASAFEACDADTCQRESLSANLEESDCFICLEPCSTKVTTCCNYRAHVTCLYKWVALSGKSDCSICHKALQLQPYHLNVSLRMLSNFGRLCSALKVLHSAWMELGDAVEDERII